VASRVGFSPSFPSSPAKAPPFFSGTGSSLPARLPACNGPLIVYLLLGKVPPRFLFPFPAFSDLPTRPPDFDLLLVGFPLR